MKELSIEEKAKHYDEAIERASELMYVSDKESLQCKTIESIFPELKESEDERIKNFISNELACLRAIDEKGTVRYNELTEAIAWLEKQGEHREDATRYKITEYLKNLILDQSQRGSHMLDYEGRIEEEVDFIISIAKKELKKEKQGEQKCNEEYNITGIKSKNAEGKLGEMIMNLKSVNEVLEQKPAEWSEEDKKMFVNIKACLRNANKDYSAELDWLKSLKPQKQWKPSKDQINALKWILMNVPYCKHKEEIDGLLEQLKQL